MSKRLFLIFILFIVVGSAVLLNQYAPIPITTPPTPIVSHLPINSSDVPQLAKTLTITSTPNAVTIYLDDTIMGTTPLTLAQLEHNSYSLRAEKTGYTTTISTLIPSASNGFVHLNLLTQKTENNTDTVSPTTRDTDSANNSDDLLANDPQIPTELLGKVAVPNGFRFPIDSTDLTQRINLEIIPPSPTDQLSGLARSDLIVRLATLYYYEPSTISIMLDTTFTPHSIAIFTGTSFDPVNSKMSTGDNILWFNSSVTTCQLRTDPQSPVKINQLLPSGKALTMTLTEKGIYIFFCQGQPGPIHTLVVS